MVVLAVKGLLWGFCLFFNLFFFYLLLITNYAPCVSSFHHCEEPGPDVPDNLLVGMKGLLLGAPEPFLQAEATQLPQPPLPGPVLQPP